MVCKGQLVISPMMGSPDVNSRGNTVILSAMFFNVSNGPTYRHTREETSFCKAQEESCDEQTLVVLHNSHEGHDEAPGAHD
jgi:hypothetical protein